MKKNKQNRSKSKTDKLQQSLPCTLQRAHREVERVGTRGECPQHMRESDRDTGQNTLFDSKKPVTETHTTRRQVFQTTTNGSMQSSDMGKGLMALATTETEASE